MQFLPTHFFIRHIDCPQNPLILWVYIYIPTNPFTVPLTLVQYNLQKLSVVGGVMIISLDFSLIFSLL